MADAGRLLPSKVAFINKDYESACLAAEKSFKGNLLVYFFESGSEDHKNFVEYYFGYQPAADFINENFACMAVDTTSPEGIDMFKEVVKFGEFKMNMTNFIQYENTSTGVRSDIHYGIGENPDESDILSWLSNIQMCIRIGKASSREALIAEMGQGTVISSSAPSDDDLAKLKEMMDIARQSKGKG